jgi:hypothetical protein
MSSSYRVMSHKLQYVNFEMHHRMVRQVADGRQVRMVRTQRKSILFSQPGDGGVSPLGGGGAIAIYPIPQDLIFKRHSDGI